MKTRELIERLQSMEQDATVTVGINVFVVRKGRAFQTRDDVRVDGVNQHGAGTMATVRLETEDDLKLDHQEEDAA